MYTYAARTSITTSSTPGTWTFAFSVVPGGRAVRLRGVKADSQSYATAPLYFVLTRRGLFQTTSTVTGSVLPFTLDPAASPLFTVYTPGTWSHTAGYTDVLALLEATGTIGNTEWVDGDPSSLVLPAYDRGCLDLQVSSPSASVSANITIFLEENPFRGRLDLAGGNTNAIKSRVRRRR
jgi:hypothetical protein